ncbi:hypothetical protein UZ36_04265 [Candidatus Nitromaritima sp. SCGC AAA799-C22]|nr:hypothetical protein UZ36_04265 [Candidatus Nitromaritima sp. SCGC AAA799-C22]
MKRNFLTAVAVMVTAFFVGTTLAQAADISFSGQLRPRFEVNEQHDDTDTTDADFFASLRMRLNAKVNVNADTGAFIQLQSVRGFGDNLTAVGTNTRSGSNPTDTSAGSGSGPFTPNDNDDSVGIHQAYFTLANFAGLPATLKLGRQEVVLDGHRLLGNTGWTQGASSHDALALLHSEGNHTIAYVYSIANEDSRPQAGTDGDVDVHVVWGNFKGILGGALSTYVILVDDDFGQLNGAANSDNSLWWTLGFRQAGTLYGIDYRGEFYYQTGQAEAGPGTAATGAVAGAATSSREAYMFGVRVGKKFNNVMWKPKVTVWYDYLSGTDDSDLRDGDWGTFDTLFDTGHKFYGFMDNYLNNTGASTDFFGLTDLAVKMQISPRDKWTVKVDWHQFDMPENPWANPTRAAAAGYALGDRNDGGDLGNEWDVTVVHKYNSNVNIVGGWSIYDATPAFHIAQESFLAAGNDSAQWAYLMFDVKF